MMRRASLVILLALTTTAAAAAWQSNNTGWVLPPDAEDTRNPLTIDAKLLATASCIKVHLGFPGRRHQLALTRHPCL